MEISKRIRHEHAELRSLAQQILNQGDGAESREQDFRSYERQLREHLDLFEAFFLKRLKDDPTAKDSAADIKSEHALVRKELKALHKGDKDGHQWTAEFRRFTDRFEHLCHRHDALVSHAEASGRSEWLDQQYESTKARRTRSFFSPPASRGSFGAMFVGAAAAAGAAYFLSRYLKSDAGGGSFNRLRRRDAWSEEGSSGAAFESSPGSPDVVASPVMDTRPAFDFQPGTTTNAALNDAPDTDGARTAPNPATAPSASGIIIS